MLDFAMNKFTNGAGLEFACEPMDAEASKLYMTLLMNGDRAKEITLDDPECPFPIAVILKRIEAFKLPIKFTPAALLSSLIFTGGSPGKAVVMLVDALSKYEGQTVDMEQITNLYPFGFYTEDAFNDYVDNYLKPRKIKWAKIY